MPRKLTLYEIDQFFRNEGCKLLAIEYIDAKTKMPYICSCGNQAEITFNNFQQGNRCRKCSGCEKLTFEYVKQFFESQRCILLTTEYINNRTKMPYICSCGNQAEITFGNFQQGNKCRKCAGTEKLTFEYVKQFFTDHQCKLLATEYINSQTKMPYICSCGNQSKIVFGSFQQGNKCRKCSGREKFTFEYVKLYFESQGCILLEKNYIDVETKMSYICFCGEKSVINFNHFQNGRRCKKCAIQKRTNSYHLHKKLLKNIDIDSLKQKIKKRIDELTEKNDES